MKALQFIGDNRCQVNDLEVPAIGPDEVRIPVEAKRLSVPAGRGCQALPAQAVLDRVEED